MQIALGIAAESPQPEFFKKTNVATRKGGGRKIGMARTCSEKPDPSHDLRAEENFLRGERPNKRRKTRDEERIQFTVIFAPDL